MAERYPELHAALAVLPDEIRQMLREDLPPDRQRCEAAATAGRWAELREQVHRLKGTAQFCRLEALQEVCMRLERALDTSQSIQPTDVQILAAEIDKILVALGP